MYRLLWESELFVFVPDHPEIHGEFPLENGDEFVFCIYPHKEGPFMAVFTSEAAADWAGEQIPPPAPALAGIRGEALFRMAEKAGMWVRVNHGMRAGIIQEPKGVAAMVRGDWTELRGAAPATGRRWWKRPPKSCPRSCSMRSRAFARIETGRSPSMDSSRWRTRRWKSTSIT